MGGGHLHDLLARFRQGGANLRETIEAQAGQDLCLILGTTPAPDHDRQGGKPGSQPFTEIARLGKAAGRYEPNTDECWHTLLHEGEYFGSEQAGLGDLEITPP